MWNFSTIRNAPSLYENLSKLCPDVLFESEEVVMRSFSRDDVLLLFFSEEKADSVNKTIIRANFTDSLCKKYDAKLSFTSPNESMVYVPLSSPSLSLVLAVGVRVMLLLSFGDNKAGSLGIVKEMNPDYVLIRVNSCDLRICAHVMTTSMQLGDSIVSNSVFIFQLPITPAYALVLREAICLFLDVASFNNLRIIISLTYNAVLGVEFFRGLGLFVVGMSTTLCSRLMLLIPCVLLSNKDYLFFELFTPDKIQRNVARAYLELPLGVGPTTVNAVASEKHVDDFYTFRKFTDCKILQITQFVSTTCHGEVIIR